MKRKGGVDDSTLIANNLDSMEDEIDELMKEVYKNNTKTKGTQIDEYNKLAVRFKDIESQIKQKLSSGDSNRSRLFKRLDELKEKIEPVEAMLRYGQPVSKAQSTTEPIVQPAEGELNPIYEEGDTKIKEANEKLGGRSKKRTRKARKAFKKNKTRKA